MRTHFAEATKVLAFARKPQGLACASTPAYPRQIAGRSSKVTRISDEIAGTTLGALALFALGDISDLAVLENGLHLDLSAAGAEKPLRGARRTSVLGNLCHG